MTTVVKCSVCQQDFKISPSRIGVRKNCSKECQFYAQNGCKTWNNGITKHGDPRLVAAGIKISKAKSGVSVKHEGQFKPNHTPWNKGTHIRFGGHNGLKGKDHPNWRGGFVTRGGYRAIMVSGKRVYEHRYVTEQHLGRKLGKDEHIHHLNHNRKDNRIENLRVINPSEHSRYHATVMWSKQRRTS